MQRSIVLVAVLLIAAGAVWWLRQAPSTAPPAGEPAASAAAAPQENPRPEAASATRQVPDLETAGPGAPAPAARPDPARAPGAAEPGSAVGRLPDPLRPWRPDPDPLARPGPRRPEAQKVWDRRLAPLLHPAGHPRAGRFREGVALEQAVEAIEAYQQEIHADDPPAHVPLLQVERHLTLSDARDLTPGLDWRLSEDRVRIYEILRDTSFENPGAPLRPFTFLAPPEGHPDATTRAERERARALDAVREQLGANGDAGPSGE